MKRLSSHTHARVRNSDRHKAKYSCHMQQQKPKVSRLHVKPVGRPRAHVQTQTPKVIAHMKEQKNQMLDQSRFLHVALHRLIGSVADSEFD